MKRGLPPRPKVVLENGKRPCRGCGAAEEVKTPTPVEAFVKRLEAFQIEHERCVAAEPQVGR